MKCCQKLEQPMTSLLLEVRGVELGKSQSFSIEQGMRLLIYWYISRNSTCNPLQRAAGIQYEAEAKVRLSNCSCRMLSEVGCKQFVSLQQQEYNYMFAAHPEQFVNN